MVYQSEESQQATEHSLHTRVYVKELMKSYKLIPVVEMLSVA